MRSIPRQQQFLPLARSERLHKGRGPQSHFSRIGTPMWRSRAEQVSSTAATFSPQKLQEALRTVFAADRALRDTRPDDRVVMEDFVLRLTR